MATRNEIQLLNLAYFGRPSDPAGLSGWESTGLNSSEIVLRFVDTEEYQFNTIRPNQQGQTPNLAGLITTYYQRLFDRAPVQSEINGWVDAINQGLVNLDYLGLTIANAGLNLVGSDLANTLNNKIEQANGFSDGLAADQTLNERYTSWLAIAIGQDFNSEIGENTTDAEAAGFRAEAFARLPEAGVLIELNTPNTEVAEGSSVGVQVQGFGPDAPGTTIDYVIIGSEGFGAPDLVNGSLSGAVTLDSFGNGVLQIDILADGVDAGESFAVQFSAAPGLAISTDTITVIDGPAPNPTLQVSSSNSSVENGDSFVFTVTSTELPAGTEVEWAIAGVSSEDLGNAPTSGVVALNADGSATIPFEVSDAVSFEGDETASLTVVAAGLTASSSIVINNTEPDPTLQVSSSNSSVENGDSFVFTVTSTELPAGTQVQWAIAGVSSEDLGNAPTSGVVTLNADGSATIPFQVSETVSFEGDETADLTIVAAGLTASSSIVINNTDIPPVQSVLTTETDVVTNTGAEFFTVFGNEATLGQNDQISSEVEGAVLQIGTEGGFTIGNFTSTNIDVFEFNPSVSFGGQGFIDMRNAFGVTVLEFIRSSLDSFVLDDLQSAEGLLVAINDSFTDYLFNFDSTVLTGSADSLDVIFAEAPIDAQTGESLGLIVEQGPANAPASLETLRLTSAGVATDENVLGVVSVGPDLETLVIDGDVSLKVEQDLGLTQDSALGAVAGNSLIEFINAANLDGNLYGGDVPGTADFLTYTSEVDGDVVVLGAQGFNYLQLNSAVDGVTNFDVFTQGGDDSVFTSSGDDFISAFEGDNSVDGGTGDDFVITGSGDDDIQGQEGDDTITSGGGDDVINSDDGNDSVLAGNGDNNVIAGAGDNTVISLEGSDTILAFNGDDSVDSGFGDDIVITGDGADTIVSEGGNNTIIAGVFTDPDNIQDSGDDSVVTGGGDDTIVVTGGSDTVRSGAGNDVVIEGNVGGGAIPIDGDSNFIFLEEGDDELVKNIENLQSDDVIDGGAGIDTVTFTAGGVLRESETLQTSNIEAFDLVDGGNFDITLSNELIATSDNIVGNQRIFSVFTGDGFTPGDLDSAGSVTLDLTNIDPISEGLANEPLINSIRYFGQNDGDTETVIVNDAIMSQFTELRFGEAPANLIEVGALNLDSDFLFDVIVVQDSAEITNSDLSNVDGLEVFDLTATINGDSDFVFDFSAMSIADFQRLVGDIGTYPEDPLLIDDGLLFRATPSLNTASASSLTLILPIDSVAAAYVGERIVIEESAELNVFVENEVVGSEVTIDTALFFTPNADDLNPAGQTVVAFELNDVQAADRVTDSGGGVETIDFRFGLANRALSMQTQLNNVRTDEIDIFEFNPGAINQAVEFDGLFPAPPAAQTITGLDSVITSGGDDFMINIEQTLFVASNNGDDTVTANPDTQLFGGVLTVTAGLGNDSVVGFENGGDSLVGNAGDDTISGLGGNDFIAGDEVDGSGTGNDSILSGSGNDTVIAGNGDNSVDSGTGNDSVTSGAGSDTIDSGDNNDTVTSGAGDDSVTSGAGADSVIAGLGNDTVLAGLGEDSVTSGAGADSVSTALGVEVENDTVSAGLGDDTILVGLGDDSVIAGAENDLIVLASSISTAFGGDRQFPTAGNADGFTTGDRIDGGDGFDTLAFSLNDPGSTTTVTGTQVQNVEEFNVAVGAANQTLIADTTLLPLPPQGGRLAFNFEGDVFSDGVNFAFDATSFVQGEAVDVYTTGLDSSSSYNFGSGDDTFVNGADGSDNVTVAGNGGADIITLSPNDFSDSTSFVRYNTGNDGGVAGAAVGGDSVRNFEVGVDKVQIASDIPGSPAPGTQAFGLLFDLTQKQSSASSDALLISVENQQLVLGGQTAFDGIGTIPGLGQNMLFLTGPARSLTDAELTDASAIAEAINNVGVIGNGLEFGEGLPADPAFLIEQQSNQALIVQQGQTGTALWLYIESEFSFDDPLSYTAEANELRQLAIFDGALLTTGDFETNLGTAVLAV